MMKIIFTETTVKDFLDNVLNNSNKDIEELGYYFIVNGIFLPIDEIDVYVGGVKVRNAYQDDYLNVDTNEKGMIWHKEEK